MEEYHEKINPTNKIETNTIKNRRIPVKNQ